MFIVCCSALSPPFHHVHNKLGPVDTIPEQTTIGGQQGVVLPPLVPSSQTNPGELRSSSPHRHHHRQHHHHQRHYCSWNSPRRHLVPTADRVLALPCPWRAIVGEGSNGNENLRQNCPTNNCCMIHCPTLVAKKNMNQFRPSCLH